MGQALKGSIPGPASGSLLGFLWPQVSRSAPPQPPRHDAVSHIGPETQESGGHAPKPLNYEPKQIFSPFKLFFLGIFPQQQKAD